MNLVGEVETWGEGGVESDRDGSNTSSRPLHLLQAAFEHHRRCIVLVLVTGVF